MSENISQLLHRSLQQLSAKKPLFINLPSCDFIHEYQERFSEATLTCFNSNFEYFQQHQLSTTYQSFFGATYDNAEQHDLVVIYYPKEKKELSFILAMLQAYVTKDAVIVVVGEKASGINSSKKVAEPYIAHYQKSDSARHCMLFTGQYENDVPVFKLEQWFEQYTVNIQETSIEVAALPGVFSQKKLDIGTKVLLENLPTISTGSLLDFGCGAGVIASFVAKKATDITLTLTDVSALALVSAEKTLSLNTLNGTVHATDSLSHITGSFDTVITNPPFHQGVKTNYQATESFLSGIHQKINKSGELLVVANNFLTYEPIMKKSFKQVSEKANQPILSTDL